MLMYYGITAESTESDANTQLDAVRQLKERGAKVKMDAWETIQATNTDGVGRVCKDVAFQYLKS